MAIKQVSIPFQSINQSDWRAQVDKELKGKSYDDFLIWKTQNGFDIESWQQELPTTIPAPPLKVDPWKIMEPISETDAQHANKMALDALNNGAESIWFDKSFKGAAAEVVCNQIDQSIAPVFINESNVYDAYKPFLKRGVEWNLPDAGTILLDGERFRERGASPVHELAILISQVIELNRHATKVEVLIKTAMGSSLLMEIAKLRALRWLIDSVNENMQNTVDYPRFIASNLSSFYSINDEYTNLLRATNSALAGVLGGADYICVRPWDKQWKGGNPFSARISRNIQNLLKEESKLDKSFNPMDGSYFVENLTNEIARCAWEKVRSIEDQGGFLEYSRKGQLMMDMQDNREEIIKSHLNQESVLLGVNKYQPVDMKPEPLPTDSEYQMLPPILHLSLELQNSDS
ncbi:MAG: hypothetical protein Salg2KO_12570 [Salibacteraceae bacterium]